MSTSKDLACVLKAVQLIIEAQVKLQKETLNHICRTSSIPPVIQQCLNESCKMPKNFNVSDVASTMKDGTERINSVVQGLRVYADLSLGNGKRY